MDTARRRRSRPKARLRKNEMDIKETPGEFWLDIGTRAVLGGFFAFSAGRYLKAGIDIVRAANAAHSMTLEQGVNLLSMIALTLFVGIIAYLYAVRLPPVSKSLGWVPTVVALLGAFLTWGLVLLPIRTDLSIHARILAAGLVLTGNIFAIYALRFLGRSFSILPQGRRLVTGGPYRFIRHPVYLAEAVATFGAMINFLSPEAVGLVIAQFCMQIARMDYEEKILRETFPEYEHYRRRTARLIPGLY